MANGQRSPRSMLEWYSTSCAKSCRCRISFTQPETFGSGLPFQEGRLPPSSAMPAEKDEQDARRFAMSQQVSARRRNVPSASFDPRGFTAGAAASQFTQAMNYMVCSFHVFCLTPLKIYVLLLDTMVRPCWRSRSLYPSSDTHVLSCRCGQSHS